MARVEGSGEGRMGVVREEGSGEGRMGVVREEGSGEGRMGVGEVSALLNSLIMLVII